MGLVKSSSTIMAGRSGWPFTTKEAGWVLYEWNNRLQDHEDLQSKWMDI
jgi:hypothetical protein